jgi:hypothetical protein
MFSLKENTYMKTLSKCPPLTPDDILILRGKPMAKKIEYNNSLEEWIYYNKRTNTCESYIFKNGQVVNWNTEKVICVFDK